MLEPGMSFVVLGLIIAAILAGAGGYGLGRLHQSIVTYARQVRLGCRNCEMKIHRLDWACPHCGQEDPGWIYGSKGVK